MWNLLHLPAHIFIQKNHPLLPCARYWTSFQRVGTVHGCCLQGACCPRSIGVDFIHLFVSGQTISKDVSGMVIEVAARWPVHSQRSVSRLLRTLLSHSSFSPKENSEVRAVLCTTGGTGRAAVTCSIQSLIHWWLVVKFCNFWRKEKDFTTDLKAWLLFPCVAGLFDIPNGPFKNLSIAKSRGWKGALFPTGNWRRVAANRLQLGRKQERTRGWLLDHLCWSCNPGQLDWVN